MTAVAIIPARYHSTRFPGKPLADINGRPMIVHVYKRAAAASLVERVIVATDDERIERAITEMGGEARLAVGDFDSGTDRIAYVAKDLDAEIIVNLQGDEPFIRPETIDRTVRPLLDAPDLLMSTVKHRITSRAVLGDPNVVKVVTDGEGYALYFSRSPLPCPHLHERAPSGEDNAISEGHPSRFYKHIGLYVYRRELLLRYPSLPRGPLEREERLEQLRALENGIKIMVVESEHDSLGVDTPEDLAEAVRMLKAEEFSPP